MAASTIRNLLKTPGLRPLFAAQFLGALNDNIYRMMVSLFAVSLGHGAAQESGYLALIGALFILPYLLFSGIAGRIADRLDKRHVLVAAKACEIAIMALGVLALASGRLDAMLTVLFLIATQATFFSPARYGIIPELVPARDLAPANGMGEMSIFLAIVLGAALGGVLYHVAADDLASAGFVLVAVAIVGFLASLVLPRRAAAVAPAARTGLAAGIRLMRDNVSIRRAVIGLSYFWFLGALLQLDVVVYGKELLALDDASIGLLQAALGAGIALGSFAAGHLSGERVRLGLVPAGCIGMGAAALLFAHAAPSFALSLAALALIGAAGGFFVVPLVSFLQKEAPEGSRASLFAANNVFNMLGVLGSSAVFYAVSGLLEAGPDRLVAVFGATAFVMAIFMAKLSPGLAVRAAFSALVRAIYRIRVHGAENLPEQGPALLLCNHVSFADGLLIAAASKRPVWFLINRRFHDMWPLSRLLRGAPVIPIDTRTGKSTRAALEAARTALAAGNLVCIFPEGALSRTGNLLPFKRGFERIAAGVGAPIVPVHLGGMWGSIFSFKGGRFFRKRPDRLPRPVTVSFGAPLPSDAPAHQARQAVQELGADAGAHSVDRHDLLHLRFLRAAKRRLTAFCMADSTGRSMRYGQVLAASLLLARRFRRDLPGQDMVGVMLPAGIAGALVNIALLFAGKVPVNLNFTLGAETLAASMRRAGLSTVITSPKLLAKRNIAPAPFHRSIEDVLGQVGRGEKIVAALAAYLLPARAIAAMLPDIPEGAAAIATVIFSSGSTGDPKGVVLSHANVLSNAEAVAQVFPVAHGDRIAGVLPFFHSFGFSGTLWIPLLHGVGAVYHSNPLEARQVGHLVAKHAATMLIATPTFCRAYLAGCAPQDLKTLRTVIVGAEKLQAGLAERFRAVFGVDLMEGYGATEMGPVIAVNRPDIAHWTERQTGNKFGSVGHPLPSVAVRVVDPETGEEREPGRDGLLLVKGPGRFQGYLGDPARTAEAMRGDWYVTGDIGHVDEDGFVTLTDRLARFSKIAGEMVPHGRIEGAVSQVPGVEACFVTGRPDAQKGERLVLLYVSAAGVGAEAVATGLAISPLPTLWRPRAGDIHKVDALPTLGTGKIDLRGCKNMALALSEPAALRHAS